MKKLFLLIPALVLAIAMNATVKNITPTTPYDDHDNLRLALYYAHTEKFDTIILADGTYVEDDNYLYMDTNMVILAAEGAHPVIKMKAYAQIKNGANIKIKGLKFDGSAQGNYDYYFRFYDNSHTSLRLDNCDFYDIKQIVITAKENVHTDSCIVNNCFFHNNKKQAMYFYASNTEGRQTCDSLAITNSTFANTDALTNWISVIDIRPYGTTLTDAIKVRVDHCTFYNNPTVDSGHANIRPYKLSDVVISNCVFAMPTAYDLSATYCSAGSVTNCIAYNYVHDNNKGHAWGPTVSKSYVVAPLFKDPEHNDFTLCNASPAKGRDTNGNAMGDPRWIKESVDTIAAPAILLPADAVLTDSAGVIAGTPDTLDFKLKAFGGSHQYNSAENAKWTINVTKAGEYAFKVNAYNPSAGTSHRYTIRVYDPADEANPVLEETTSSTSAAGDYSPTTSKVTLAKKTYIVKVWNPTSWSVGKLVNVEANYEGGATIAIPDTLKPADAIRSAEAWVDKTGVVDSLLFTARGSEGHNTLNWAKWKFSVSKAGFYKFKANVSSSNGQYYKITVLNSDESATKGEKDGTGTSLGSGDKSFATDNIELAEGNYIVKIANTYNHSKGRVLNIVATYEGGAVTTLPGQLLGEDAVIYDNGKLKMTHDENGDLKYGDNIQPRGEYADWSIHVNADCKLTVSFNLAPASTSGHEFLVELRNNVGKIDSVEETVLTKYLDVPAAGDYTIRLINRTQWSQAILHGITFTPYVAPAALEINEAAIDNSAWIANVGGAAANVQLIRTFKGGVYNSICVPFEAPMSKIKAAFGDDVELLYLNDANMSGDILNLVFANAPDFYQGTPYLIKPSTDVVNPEFANVNLLAAEAASTSHTGWPASFKGTFIKQDIDADPNNLYLGTDNKLYFSNNDVTIKGLRAYFHVNTSNAQQVIKHARIMKGTQVLTDVELVETENNAVKSIENGQLIITIDGVRYNVMGAKIQ